MLLSSVALAQVRDPFTMLERLAAVDGPAQGATVEVLDSDLQPLADISVGFASNALLRDPKTQTFRAGLGRLYREDLFLKMGLVGKYGQRFVTGADGLVTLPNDESGYVVAIARKDGKRFAVMKALRKGVEELTLELAALKEIAVRVVDQRGRPVFGMPVAASPWANDVGSDGTVAGWTDRKGIAYVRSRWIHSAQDTLTVAVAFVGKESVAKTLDLGDGIPEGIVALQMPPFGQVKTILYDDDGKPSDQVTRATIEIENRFGEGQRYQRWTAPITDPDGATFPAVGLNQHVKIHLSLKGSRSDVLISGTGPRQLREMTILTPEAASEVVAEPTLSIRILDRDGEPVKAEKLGIAFIDSRYAKSFTSRTDKAGRLDVAVPQRHRESDGVWVYIMRRGSGVDDGSVGGMSLELPEEIPKGRFDVGDRRLADEPVRLAGRFVDDKGKPVRGVEVRVDRVFRRPSSSWSGSSEFRGPVVHTDAEGRFEIRHVFDELNDIDVKLKGHYVKEMPDWSLGDTDVEFVMARAGKVVARLADPPADAIHLTLVKEGEPDQEWQKWAHKRNGKAEVSWDVPPGTYTLYLGNVAEEGVVCDKIEVDAGKAVDDARLASIDWTKYLTELSVSVADEQGKRIPDVDVMFWTKNNRGWSGSGTSLDIDEESARELVAKSARVAVHIEAEGYADFLADNVKQDVKAVLIKLKRVKVALVGDLELPDDMRVGITLVQDGKNQKRLRDLPPVPNSQPEPEVFVAGVAQPYVDGDADCEIWLTLMRAKRDGEYRPKTLRILHDLPDFKVTEETLRQGVKLVVDADLKQEVESTIEQLRER